MVDVGPAWVRRRPWLAELVLVAIGYAVYTMIRDAVTARASVAVGHARGVVRVEQDLDLFHEHGFNAFVATHHWLAYACDYYYASLHFVITVAVAVWVWRRHRGVSRGLRNAWYAMNLFALLGFAFYALAPPRLLPSGGFVDTVVAFHTWGSWGDASVAAHTNQYAAMPSMHIGWSLWCAIVVVRLAPRRPIRTLAALYPVWTLLVILGTANHYVLDAVGGALACLAGFGLARLLNHGPLFDDQHRGSGPCGSGDVPEPAEPVPTPRVAEPSRGGTGRVARQPPAGPLAAWLARAGLRN